jgi:ABC-type amino acid transport substrate-binding protein
VSAKSSPLTTITELEGKTVAFPKGFFYEEILTKQYPNIVRFPVDDTLASLRAVSLGDADAAVGEDAVVRSIIARNMLTDLFISGEVEIGNPDIPNLRIGARDPGVRDRDFHTQLHAGGSLYQ